MRFGPYLVPDDATMHRRLGEMYLETIYGPWAVRHLESDAS
jgi:hypothetical protein